ncbi:MAG TPA: ABC transporter permease [Candidatus Limnocylindrales bacterium]|nr:ABC transporter permease [Candidatus Limnocylindrales bacterium]
MTKFIIRRLLGLLPLLFGVLLISFILMKWAPGGPQAALAGNKSITQAEITQWLRRWCLQRETTPISVLQEFGGWLGVLNCDKDGLQAFTSDQGGLNFLPRALGGGDNGILHGDLGLGIRAGRPVLSLITERMPATLVLTTTALILWVSVAILAGLYAAVNRYSLFDQGLTFFSYVFYSLPTFWLGLMLIFAFAVRLDLLPTSGMITVRQWSPFNTPQYWAQFWNLDDPRHGPLAAIVDVGRHLILPVITLVAVNIAADSRFVRASMLEALGQDYVRTARAKGLASRVVVGKHAFRNAMLPVVTNVALEIPFLFSGAIVTETIFTWPGMGRLFIESVNARDYFVLMGLFLVTAVIVLIANLAADVLYAIVDPRIRYD